MKKSLLSVVFTSAVLTGCNTISQVPGYNQQTAQVIPTANQCQTLTSAQVTGLFDKWNATLRTQDPRQVAGLYAADAVLLPTVSNKPRTSQAEIEDYFAHFLPKQPQGTIKTRTIKIGCNWASDVGTYDFSLRDAKKQPVVVSARYSFIYTRGADNQWRISHHHSSAMPEVVIAQAH